MSEGWIGVDLDGTLAHYDHWRGIEHVGEPVPAMADRVVRWLREGREVRIFTARCFGPDGAQAAAIVQDWGRLHFGHEFVVTNVKDFAMLELWDDRAVQVEANTGLAYVHPHGVPTP
jgi:hypothetical protein